MIVDVFGTCTGISAAWDSPLKVTAGRGPGQAPPSHTHLREHLDGKIQFITFGHRRGSSPYFYKTDLSLHQSEIETPLL